MLCELVILLLLKHIAYISNSQRIAQLNCSNYLKGRQNCIMLLTEPRYSLQSQ